MLKRKGKYKQNVFRQLTARTLHFMHVKISGCVIFTSFFSGGDGELSISENVLWNRNCRIKIKSCAWRRHSVQEYTERADLNERELTFAHLNDFYQFKIPLVGRNVNVESLVLL